MKRPVLAIAVLLAVGSCAGTTLLLDKGPKTATLHVEIQGIRGDSGQLGCALFGTPEGFPAEPASAARTRTLPVSDAGVEWTISDLPTGYWAISVMHDADGDGRMATDWMGRPTEGWGVSNDARGSFGPPSFDDAAVEVGPGESRIVIHLSY